MPKLKVVLNNKEKPKLHENDAAWRAESVRNAKQCANIFIEFGNAKKVAGCFDDFSLLDALEHLHSLADEYRHDSQFKKAAVILEAAQIIQAQRGVPKEESLHEHWHQFRKPLPKMRRVSPAEVLAQ